MTLQCLHCKYRATSIKEDNEKALTEIVEFLTKHLTKNHAAEHKKMLNDVTTASSLSIFLVLVFKHSTFLNEDNLDSLGEYIDDKIEEGCEALREAVGMPENDEDDELDPDVEDGDFDEEGETLPIEVKEGKIGEILGSNIDIVVEGLEMVPLPTIEQIRIEELEERKKEIEENSIEKETQDHAPA